MCTNYRNIVLESGRSINVKCGHCPACLYEKQVANQSRIFNNTPSDWNKRTDNFFITLTYSNENIPLVNKKELLDFYRQCQKIDSWTAKKAYYNNCRFDDKYHIPFSLSDFPGEPFLNVYRFNDIRRVPVGNGHYNFKSYPGKHIIATLSRRDFPENFTDWFEYEVFEDGMSFEDYICNHHFHIPENECRKMVRPGLFVKDERYIDYFPITLYKDVQDYMKRVRITFERFYCKPGEQVPKIKVFIISEYGETYGRPHFHILASVPKGRFSAWKRTFMSSWQYDRNLRRKVEVAVNPASYLSTYVNSTSDVPLLCQRVRKFRPISRASSFYGSDNEDVCLSKILEMFYKHDFHIDNWIITKDGIAYRPYVLPKRVLSRYFPKFKGFSRLSPDEVSNIVRCPQILARNITEVPAQYVGVSGLDEVSLRIRNKYSIPSKAFAEVQMVSPPEYFYLVENHRKDFPIGNAIKFDSPSEINSQISFIYHQYIKSSHEISLEEFAFVYGRIWSSWQSFLFKWSHRDDKNLDDYYNHIDSIEFKVPKYYRYNNWFSSFKYRQHHDMCSSLMDDFVKFNRLYIPPEDDNVDFVPQYQNTLHLDIQKRPDVIQSNIDKERLFWSRSKIRKIQNRVNSQFVNV